MSTDVAGAVLLLCICVLWSATGYVLGYHDTEGDDRG